MPLLGGVRPPLAALLCLLLAVAAVTLVGIGRTDQSDIAPSVRDAERAIAVDTANDLHSSVSAHADALRESVSAFTSTAAAHTAPAAALKALVPRDTSGRGAALLDSRTGSLLAGSGESLPLSAVHTAQSRRDGRSLDPTLVANTGAGPRLLYFARVTPPGATSKTRWLLAVSETVQLPKVHGEDRSVQLLLPGGHVLASAGSADVRPPASGTPAPSPSPSGIQRIVPVPASTARALPQQDHGLLARAASYAADPDGPGAGSLLGARSDDRRTVAGWASVSSGDDARDLPMTVLTYRAVAPRSTTTTHAAFAAEAAGALVVLTLLVWLLLWLTVQRPLLRLHLSATRLASAAASDRAETRGALARPVPVPAFGEPARIGRALESLRRQIGTGADAPAAPSQVRAGRGPGLRALVVVCALVLAAWAVPLLFLLNQADAPSVVPKEQVTAQQSRTQAAADRTRASLEQATTELQSVAPRLGSGTAAERRAALRSFLRHHDRFRSVYLVNGSGRVTDRAGERPLRTVTSAPKGAGILSVSSTGRVPAVAAHVPVTVIAGGKATSTTDQVYGEIDEDRLDDRLTRPGLGSTYLVDGHNRVLAASVGFTAHQELPGTGLTALSSRTAPSGATPRHAVSDVVGAHRRGVTSDAAVAAAAPLAADGATAGLDWNVVTAEPAQALRLAAYETQWHTMLAGLLGLTVSIACLGWLHVVVVRPARSLAALATRLAEGDRRTVLYPVHHDEVGSVTRGLELLRQTLARDTRGSGQERRDRQDGSGPAAPEAQEPPKAPGAPQAPRDWNAAGDTASYPVTWGVGAEPGPPDPPGPPGNDHQHAPWA